MVDGSAVMWGSLLGSVTTYVGYQAGALKTRIVADREYRDPETGLITRKGFEHRALRKLAKSCNYVVLMVDLNDLKAVNDEFGHAAGDVFIREQASRLDNWARRKNGVVARFGGDEFAVIVDASCDLLTLREELARPICWGDKARNWTASIGVAWVSIGVLRSERKDCLSKALNKADKEMYKDKGKSGRR